MGTFTVTPRLILHGFSRLLKYFDSIFRKTQITADRPISGCGKSTFLKTLNRMNDLVPSCHIEGQPLR